eukprot:gb/GFBE01028484.1/.p1 GENE.gb/GFBE01028484.1/~~gb/GFBE01028484.1/.p1  ORF type:complete len:299 (+),score=56.67 gb/GFBE01028484.1/:1-897(+)
MQASVKNTFLVFTEEGPDVPKAEGVCLRRARSLDPNMWSSAMQEVDEKAHSQACNPCLLNLNAILSPVSAKSGEPVTFEEIAEHLPATAAVSEESGASAGESSESSVCARQERSGYVSGSYASEGAHKVVRPCHENTVEGIQKLFSHNRVPRKTTWREQLPDAAPESSATTMMIRNIPNRYKQHELMKEIDQLGLTGSYDFFYMPMDKGSMCNVGYAFVNFVDHTWATQCSHVMNGYRFLKHQHREKLATVSVAHLQGLQANLRHYENTAVKISGRKNRSGPGPVLLTPTVPFGGSLQ